MAIKKPVLVVMLLFLGACSFPRPGTSNATPTSTIGEMAERMVAGLLASEGEPPSPPEMAAGLRALGLLACASPAEAAAVAHPDEVVYLLVACGEALLIDFEAGSLPAPEHYRPAFESLRGANPDLEYAALSLDLETRPSSGAAASTVHALIEHNGVAYAQDFWYSDKIRVDYQFHWLANRILADLESDRRFFRLYLTCEGCATNLHTGYGPVDPHRVPIISLTRPQAQAIQEQRLLSLCCDEFGIMKTGEIEQAIADFQSLGLLDGLGADEFEQARAEVFRTIKRDGAEVLMVFDSFDDSLLHWFDLETSNFDNPYEEALLGLAGISDGEFQPAKIVDAWVYDQESQLSFELNGVKYESTLSNWMEWMDPSFIDTANQALSEQGSQGRFYVLAGRGQGLSVIFLTPDQVDYFQTAGLVSWLAR